MTMVTRCERNSIILAGRGNGPLVSYNGDSGARSVGRWRVVNLKLVKLTA